MRRHPDLARRVRSVILSSTASSVAVEAGLGLGMLQLARFERLLSRFATRYGERTVTLSRRVYRASTDLSYLLVRSIGLSAAAAPHHVDLTEQLLLDSSPDVFLGFATPVLSMDEGDALPCLTVPTWIVVGDRDRITPGGYARRMAAGCPQAELVELPGVGHMAPLEASAAFNALVERAVREAA
jgi:pimeloyl-ACP methyl ester carboxylesterase